MISLKGEDPWFCTFLYGPPHKEDKQRFWSNLSKIRNESNPCWCIIGDFNIVSNQDEKDGGAPINMSQAGCFLSFMDLSIKGGEFTWSNMRSNQEAIVERLDKIIVSNKWSLIFPKAIGILEAATISDHNPVVLLMEGLKKERKREFKFESRWLLDEECSSNVKEVWNASGSNIGQNQFVKKLKTTRVKLKKWSKIKYGKN
ncbi:hypothetical protein V6N11_070388 [Hibiscus sabdariffa]|uniref:Endonuclease/exonuclease/phosphatase domain-containing protein n=1 Tax=Hibiscus sabdariffa TaxID=183260 RepID=A0ABR2QFA5_9ROSI